MTTKRQTILIATLMLVLSLLTPLYAQSVLDRVMKVEDPELADCLRMAMKNGRYKGYEEELKTVRIVTESYAQIKLLDTQIQQIEVKLSALSESAFSLRQELFIAQAELKAKQIQQLAQLRETMGITPRYAFGEIQKRDLSSWVTLDVVDDNTVLIFNLLKSFFEEPNYQFETACAPQEAIDNLTQRMKQPNQLPLRVNILHLSNVPATAEQIQSQLMEVINKLGLEMDIDLRTSPSRENTHFKGTCAIANHLSSSAYCMQVKGKEVCGFKEIIDDNTLQHQIVTTLLGSPDRLPVTWTLEYDPESLELAKNAAQAIEKVSKEYGLQDYVEVKLQPTESEWLPPEQWKANR